MTFALPEELLIAIMHRLPLTDMGARTLSNCCMTGHGLLREAALEPALWKPFYKARYKHAEGSHEAQRLGKYDGDWRKMYGERRRLDNVAVERLKRIVVSANAQERIRLSREVVSLGFDVWDILEEEGRRPLHPLLQTENDVTNVEQGKSLGSLSFRYWSTELSRIICCRHAIDVWTSLISPEPELPEIFSFEDVFATLSSFHGILPETIRSDLHSIYMTCKSELDCRGVSYDPNDSKFSTLTLSKTLCALLRDIGFAMPIQHEFLDVRNSLPHFFLDNQRRCLPLSQAYVLVCVARKLGLRAAPLNTPVSVMALLEDVVVNIATSTEDSAFNQLSGENGLKKYFIPEEERENITMFLLRASRNIAAVSPDPMGTQIRDYSQTSWERLDAGPEMTGKRLAACIQACFDSVIQERGHFPRHPSWIVTGRHHVLPSWLVANGLYPLDAELLIRDKNLFAMNDGESYDLADSLAEPASSEDFFAGRIVMTSPYGYGALKCIVGFKKNSMQKVKCVVLTLDAGSSTLNAVDPDAISLPVTMPSDFGYISSNRLLGLFFESIEVFEEDGITRARFVMNEYWRTRRPQDDIRGASWVRSGSTITR